MVECKDVVDLCRVEGISLPKIEIEEMFDGMGIDCIPITVEVADYIDPTFIEEFPILPKEKCSSEFSFDGNRICRIWANGKRMLIWFSSDGKAEESYLLFN